MTSFISSAIARSAEMLGVSESKFKHLAFCGGALVIQGVTFYYTLYPMDQERLSIGVAVLSTFITATGLVMVFES